MSLACRIELIATAGLSWQRKMYSTPHIIALSWQQLFLHAELYLAHLSPPSPTLMLCTKNCRWKANCKPKNFQHIYYYVTLTFLVFQKRQGLKWPAAAALWMDESWMSSGVQNWGEPVVMYTYKFHVKLLLLCKINPNYFFDLSNISGIIFLNIYLEFN